MFDINGVLCKIQVKSAWFDETSKNYLVDSRQSKTNRRVMLRTHYKSTDFDFALLYIDKLDIFYIIPVEEFINYKSLIHLVEDDNRQRKAKSSKYRDKWELINIWSEKVN